MRHLANDMATMENRPASLLAGRFLVFVDPDAVQPSPFAAAASAPWNGDPLDLFEHDEEQHADQRDQAPRRRIDGRC